MKRWLLALPIVAALAGAALWLGRADLAQRAVETELARRGVPGAAVVERVSPRSLTVRDLRLGPAARPDLVAERAEIALDWEGTRPVLAGIRLERPTLRLAVDGEGRVRLGALDRLLPPRTGEPPRFPDLPVAVEDGLVIARTPLGELRARVTGEGNAARALTATAELLPATLRLRPCSVRIAGRLRVRTEARRGFVTGRLTAPATGCAGATAQALALDIDLAGPESLDRATGRLALAATRPAGFGARASTARATFAGELAASGVTGDLALALDRPAWRDIAATAARLAGPVAYDPARAEFDGAGRLRATSITLAPAARARIATPLAGLATTPLAPFERALRRAAVRALADFDLNASLNEASEGDQRYLSVATVDLRAASGLVARLRDGSVIVPLGDGPVAATGRLTVAGDGLPPLVAELDGTAARVAVPNWRAGDARLAATTLALGLTRGGVRLAGPVRVDGPLGPGRVDGLTLPAADLVLGLGATFTATPARCLAVTADRLVQPRYTLADARFQLCPDGRPALAVAPSGRLTGGFTARALAARGELAGTPFAFTAPTATLTLTGTDTRPVVTIAAAPVTGTVTAAGAARAVALAAFTATATQGPSGWRFAGALGPGTVDAAPLALTAVRGDWTLDEAGAVGFTGAALLADRAPRPRFQPVALRDIRLAYAGGRLDADLALVAPAAAVALGRARVGYVFASATGTLAADLALPFGPDLQPYQLSERARGVVENVAGRVLVATNLTYADGALAGPATVTLADLSFATAALGPVTDVDGVLRLVDAPALVSAPGQRFTIGAVDPGVAVENGEVSLHLTGGGAVRIERLAFPLAGGTLTLDPVTLDPTRADRDFTLRITAMDAARFVETLELDNFAATGTFDGVLPLTTSASGSRIVNGELVARAPGGTLNYVGELGEGLPGGARLAFDALKSMRYHNLTLGIDGDLDGELVTDLRFTGENQRPVRAGGLLPAFAPGMPFRFTVKITAPFRRLLGSAASLSDARPLIEAGMNAEPPPR